MFLCVQFPAELQAEGARQLPRRQTGAPRQPISGCARQVYPRHDSETTDTQPTLEREVPIVSKHLHRHARIYSLLSFGFYLAVSEYNRLKSVNHNSPECVRITCLKTLQL
jgi:hypothetical protein